MSIIVRPINRIFKIIITHEKEKIEFGFKQLDYKTKGKITSIVTSVDQGTFTIDSAMQVFYNIKHGLKTIKGLMDENKKPYKLKFEDGPTTSEELTDECVDELLATVLSDNLQYAARELSNSIAPDKICHPITGEKLKGVEVVHEHQVKGIRKK